MDSAPGPGSRLPALPRARPSERRKSDELGAERLRELDGVVRRLDRLAALGSLATEVAHEIRNPLVSVKTFLQLLPERRDDPEFLTRFLEVANDEVRRMERLLDAVIAHGRTRDGEDDVARVEPVLASVAELVRHRAASRGIELSVEAAPACPEAALSEDALRQVLLNLALNALDATPPGGRVALRARCVSGELEIVVADSGPGIPAEVRARVFEPFVSTREERPGGLGLAIVRRIVGEAGGRIAVEDAEGGGAVFRVSLPKLRASR